MKLIDELFMGYKLNTDLLIKYGFILNNNTYSYSKKIYNNSFELKVEIKDNEIDAKVIDLDFNEENKQVFNDITLGFISTLKEECINELTLIRDNCFKKDIFIYNQSNRISNLIKDKYDALPEFLWDDTPGCGVFRNKRSNKWFGIIMNVSKNKLIGDDKTIIEVLNVNLNDMTEYYLKNKGIYPAYHMNKRNWVSIILDDTLKDNEIMDLIDISYNLANRNGNWLVPANPKYYDVINMFNNDNITNWKQYRGILVGDIIYLYIADPYKEIMYKCEVVEIDIPYDYKDDNLTITKLMKIKLIKKYKEKEFSYSKLNEYGIKAIRGPRNIPDNLLKDL